MGRAHVELLEGPLPRSVAFIAVLLFLLGTAGPAFGADPAATSVGDALIGLGTDAPAEAASVSVRLVLTLTALTMLPGVLLAMTPFTRFIIVFSLLRQALGLQQSPPNQLLIGLSLVLTMTVMQPTTQAAWSDGAYPFLTGEHTIEEAVPATLAPLRRFMLQNVKRQDLGAALGIARVARPETLEDIPTSVVVTGFVLSELRTAFTIAVKVYIPFLMVDLVVASVLLGMGMMMLPPVVVSLPFKLLVFVLMDGWSLLVAGMVAGIR
ncbi:MAG: flagellar type III secretion system pore protein FliP [Myxococcota bacterium]